MSDFLDKELKKIEKGLGAEDDYNKLLDMWRDEKKRRQFAENELSLIKAVGNNSPEMKAYQLENERLKGDVDRLVEENHNYEVISKNIFLIFFWSKLLNSKSYNFPFIINLIKN